MTYFPTIYETKPTPSRPIYLATQEANRCVTSQKYRIAFQTLLCWQLRYYYLPYPHSNVGKMPVHFPNMLVNLRNKPTVEHSLPDPFMLTTQETNQCVTSQKYRIAFQNPFMLATQVLLLALSI